MHDSNNLIQGLILLILGICLVLTWKKFSIEVAKYSIKYTKNIEFGTQICFYVIGISFVIGGLILIYKFFK